MTLYQLKYKLLSNCCWIQKPISREFCLHVWYHHLPFYLWYCTVFLKNKYYKEKDRETEIIAAYLSRRQNGKKEATNH